MKIMFRQVARFSPWLVQGRTALRAPFVLHTPHPSFVFRGTFALRALVAAGICATVWLRPVAAQGPPSSQDLNTSQGPNLTGRGDNTRLLTTGRNGASSSSGQPNLTGRGDNNQLLPPNRGNVPGVASPATGGSRMDWAKGTAGRSSEGGTAADSQDGASGTKKLVGGAIFVLAAVLLGVLGWQMKKNKSSRKVICPHPLG